MTAFPFSIAISPVIIPLKRRRLPLVSCFEMQSWMIAFSFDKGAYECGHLEPYLFVLVPARKSFTEQHTKDNQDRNRRRRKPQ